MANSPRILIAPLDWGLGHASRTVPIVRELLRAGAEVFLASNGRALSYLQAAFPELESTALPAYAVQYPSRHMWWNMARQSGRLMRVARAEHRQLQHLIRRHSIDAVISDNRFGCFSSRVYSVFITHQLNLQLPMVLRWPGRKLNHYFIRRYDSCWIPDIPGPHGLSGELSAVPSGSQVEYLGILSQLEPASPEPKASYDLLLLLSGPEPQRTYLETQLIEQCKMPGLKTLLIQGKTEELIRSTPASNIDAVSFLKFQELGKALAGARHIICRSGYSSLMDLAVAGRKALLIPTPGQTEQVYLARRMQQLGYCPTQSQKELDISAGLTAMEQYTGFPPHFHQPHLLKNAVSNLLEIVQNRLKPTK